jgi:hypothetical protein
MINNDRILTNIATASLMSSVPPACVTEPARSLDNQKAAT